MVHHSNERKGLEAIGEIENEMNAAQFFQLDLDLNADGHFSDKLSTESLPLLVLLNKQHEVVGLNPRMRVVYDKVYSLRFVETSD